MSWCQMRAAEVAVAETRRHGRDSSDISNMFCPLSLTITCQTPFSQTRFYFLLFLWRNSDYFLLYHFLHQLNWYLLPCKSSLKPNLHIFFNCQIRINAWAPNPVIWPLFVFLYMYCLQAIVILLQLITNKL